jgi:hypothetical protein
MWFVLLALGITEERITENLPTTIRVRGGWGHTKDQSLESKEEMMAEHKGTAAMAKGLKSGICLWSISYIASVQPLLTQYLKRIFTFPFAFDIFWLLALILTCIGIRISRREKREDENQQNEICFTQIITLSSPSN